MCCVRTSSSSEAEKLQKGCVAGHLGSPCYRAAVSAHGQPLCDTEKLALKLNQEQTFGCEILR